MTSPTSLSRALFGSDKTEFCRLKKWQLQVAFQLTALEEEGVPWLRAICASPFLDHGVQLSELDVLNG